MKTKDYCGYWGGSPEKLPSAVLDALDDIAVEDYDWTIRVVDDNQWLIAKLYETSTLGEIVVAKVVKSIAWSKPKGIKQ